MNLRKIRFHSPFASLYAEARLLPDIQRSLLFLLFSNIFGNMHTIICGSGTTSMIQLSNFLGAGDFEYGLITGIPLAAAFLQIPFSVAAFRACPLFYSGRSGLAPALDSHFPARYFFLLRFFHQRLLDALDGRPDADTHSWPLDVPPRLH